MSNDYKVITRLGVVVGVALLAAMLVGVVRRPSNFEDGVRGVPAEVKSEVLSWGWHGRPPIK